MSYDNSSDSIFSEDEDDFCPLCIEEMDITDKNFRPCPCGYQICQFCYNNIKTNPELNGKCPACRRPYEDKNIVYNNITAEEWKTQKAKIEKRKREKKILEKEKKDAEQAKRHHLAGMRVIQKNLVYVVGLNPPCSYDDLIPVLKTDKYFGQYGKINKIVINKRNPNPNYTHFSNSNGPGYGVYVTFARKEDATKCIGAVDGLIIDGKMLRAAHGTTKYCSSYLRGQPCPNPNCMFLHEPGEEADSYSRHDLTSRSANNRGSGQQIDELDSPSGSSTTNLYSTNSGSLNENLDASHSLPATVSWAKNKSSDIIPSSFPSLNDILPTKKLSIPIDTQSQSNQQQQNQLQQLLQKSQLLEKQSEAENHQPIIGSKKKDKKDKDNAQPVVLDSAAISYKNVCDSLKDINSMDFNYSVNPKFQTSEFVMGENYKFFHPNNILNESTISTTYGFFNTDENKAHILAITDSLLYAPYARNYNYRAYMQALQASQEQAQAQVNTQNSPKVKLNMTAFDMNTPLQDQYVQRQIKQSLLGQQAPTISNNNSTQAFLQQKIIQQQQQQQQQKSLDIGHRSSAGTPIQPPPGLFDMANNSDSKSHSQELLSQLLGKKVTA